VIVDKLIDSPITLKPLLLCQRQKDLYESLPNQIKRRNTHLKAEMEVQKERIKHPIKRQHSKAQTSPFFLNATFYIFSS
jgi:hypothetical protein